MARVRKFNKNRDGDAILSLSSDKYYEGGELYVVGGGKGGIRAYLTTHFEGRCVAFSGVSALKALRNALTTVLNQR